jgi:hypothetical protein
VILCGQQHPGHHLTSWADVHRFSPCMDPRAQTRRTMHQVCRRASRAEWERR